MQNPNDDIAQRIGEVFDGIVHKLFAIPSVRTARTLWWASLMMFGMNVLQLTCASTLHNRMDYQESQTAGIKKVLKIHNDILIGDEKQ